MLKQLRISNIILIESEQIDFKEGFNVISGETGSGKSAIMNSINLICGERTDIGMLRRGAEKGAVEAIFDIDRVKDVGMILNEAGIEHAPGDELLIRREIHATGKSRAFVNNQSAQLSLLKKIGDQLLDIAGQHANQRLLSLEQHRLIIDTYGELEQEVKEFGRQWIKENTLRKELETLLQGEAQRLRDIEVCRMELEELVEAKLKEGEEEELFAEYTLLTNAEELASHVSEINQALSGERNPIVPLLNRQKANFEHLLKLDPSLTETSKAFDNALLELQEISYTIRNYLNHIEHNPSRAHDVNERLTLINRLKRKYGSNIIEIHLYQESTKIKLDALENTDSHIEELQLQLQKLEKENQNLCQKLSKDRQLAAKKLEGTIISELRALNMPKVEFIVELTIQKCNQSGQDRIEFYLIPNVGEHKIPVRECASGGELSRLMLALQTTLSGKQQTPTLIFDEIDANIGGETASVVGEKLKSIGEKHQVLCITHFPQVARQADHHLQISKEEREGRTRTLVTSLNEAERQHELDRMLGLTTVQ